MNSDLSIAEELEAEISQIARKFAVNIFTQEILSTPVDTGQARGNWQLSTGRPSTTFLSVSDKSGGTTISKGISKVGETIIKYPTIWIVNNTPYIEDLNRGTSQQAPSMFIDSAIVKGINITNG